MNFLFDLSLLGGIFLFLKFNIAIIFLGFIGHLLCPKLNNNYISLSSNIIIGAITVSILTSIVRVGLNTYLIPMMAPLIYLMYYKYRIKRETPFMFKYDFNFLIKILILSSMIFTYNRIISIETSTDSITYMYDDNAHYSKISYDIYENRHESNFYKGLKNVENRPPYHYFELWLTSFLSKVLNLLNYSCFIFIIKTLNLFLISNFIIGICKNFKLKKSKIFLVLSLPFLTSLPPLFANIGLPWYLDFNYTNISIIHYFGAQPTLYYLIFCSTLIIIKEECLGILFYSFSAIIHPLLVLIIPLSIIILFTYELIIMNDRQRNFSMILKSRIIPIISSLFILLMFKAINNDTSKDVIGMINLYDLHVPIIIFFKVLLSSILYCPIYILGILIVINKQTQKFKTTISFLVSFLISSFIFYSFFYDKLNNNITQVIFISWNIVFIFWGFIFLIYGLSFLKRKTKYILTLLVFANILWGGVNTFSEKYSSFGPVYSWNNHEPVRNISKKDLKDLSQIIDTIGYKAGYIINNFKPRGIHLSELNYLYSINNEISIYRLNSVPHDTNQIRSNKVLKSSFFSSFNINNQINEEQIAQAINRLKIKWLFVDHSKYILPNFLKKEFNMEYEFQNFSIFKKQ